MTKRLNGTLAIVLVASLALPSPAVSTSIVALLGEKTITIAADGVSTGNPTKTGDIPRKPVCKILCKDLICFAAAGRLHDRKYDVFKLARQELANAQTAAEVSEKFRIVITPLLPAMFEAEKKEAPHRYEKYIQGLPMLVYLFAGLDSDRTPFIVRGRASIDAKGNVNPIEDFVKKGEFQKVYRFFLGNHLHIDGFTRKNPNWPNFAAANPVEFAEKLVRIEIQASEMDGSREVGEPISIISLNKNEAQFKVERGGNCSTRTN